MIQSGKNDKPVVFHSYIYKYRFTRDSNPFFEPLQFTFLNCCGWLLSTAAVGNFQLQQFTKAKRCSWKMPVLEKDLSVE